MVVGFTAIGLDHCQYLGNTIDEISKEKAGIIKKNSDVVLYPIQESKVFDNIRLICQEKNSNLIIPEYQRFRKLIKILLNIKERAMI